MINEENIYKLYSFDIFDTLITRKTATPLGIFLLMQDKLKSYDIDKHVKNNFYYIRIETERYLRRYFCNPENEDITLSLIYDLIANNYNLSEKEKNTLMDLEIELEYENSVPIYNNINLIEELVKKNNKVILISDMYLSTDVIRNMLLKHSNVFEKIKIYVSSDLKKSKSTGNLYKLIKEKEQIEYTDWIHKGDNKYADIKMAEELSINTDLYPFEPLMEFEIRLLNYYHKSCLVQLIIGMNRNLRLYNKKNIQTDLGISLGGPILYFYVNWFLENAIKNNIKSLYFIARDGFVLKNIADIIIESKKLNLKTYYIYGSREAWQIPTVVGGVPIPKSFLWKSNTICDLLYFLQLSKEDLFKFLPKKYQNISKKLNDKIRDELYKNLFLNENFVIFLREKHKEKYDLLIKYLYQEINFDENFAFVDLRGTGETLNYLATVLNKKIKLYLMYTYANYNTDNLYKYCFFNISNEYKDDSIELLARALHGQTIGYEMNNDKVIPILENIEDDYMNKINYIDYINGINIFAKNYCANFNNNALNELYLNFFIEYQKYLKMAVRNINIANFIGSIPFTTHGIVTCISEYAPKITLCDLIKYFLFNKKYLNVNISLIRSSNFIKKLHDFINKLNINLIFIKIYFNKREKYSYISLFGIKIIFRNYF